MISSATFPISGTCLSLVSDLLLETKKAGTPLKEAYRLSSFVYLIIQENVRLVNLNFPGQVLSYFQ